MSLRIPAHRTTRALRCLLSCNYINIRYRHNNSDLSENRKDSQKSRNVQEEISTKSWPKTSSAETNPKSDPKSEPNSDESESKSLSQMIYKFFQKETQIISKSFDIDAKLGPPKVNTDALPTHIQHQVQAQMDNYNKFLVLLSHHPLAVPPEVLLDYHSTLGKVDPADTKRLLRHLIFHHRWANIWDLTLQEEVTLNGMEDLVEHIHMSLAEFDDLFAIWGALETAHKIPFASPKIYALLIETVQYKFFIEQHTMNRFSDALDLLDGAQYVFSQVQDLETTLESVCGGIVELRAHFLPHILEKSSFEIGNAYLTSNVQNKNLLFASCKQALISSPGLDKIPGFISHAGETFQQMKTLELLIHPIQGTSFCISYKDFFFISQSLTVYNAHRIYKLFCRIHKQDEYVTNAFLMQLYELQCGKTFMQAIKKFYYSVSKETLIAIFSQMTSNAEGIAILRLFFRNRPAIFGSALENVLSKDVLSISSLCQMVRLVNEQTFGRKMLRSILTKLSEKCSASELSKVYANLSSMFLSEYNTTEIWRFGVKQKLLDSKNTGMLFSKILEKARYSIQSGNRGGNFSYSRLDDDIQMQYIHATEAERHRLLVRIQAISQSISIADEQQIATIIDNIFRHIFGTETPETYATSETSETISSDETNSNEPELIEIHFQKDKISHKQNSSFFITNKAGKLYIFRKLIELTAHFIYRSCTPTQGVIKLSSILRLVQFRSHELDASVHGYMVQANPRIALRILSIYQHKRNRLPKQLMNKAEQGILKTQVISGKEKLELFYEFQSKKALLQFPHSLATHTVALLGKLLFATLGPNMRSDQTKSFIQLAYEKKVPVKVIQRLIQGFKT